MCIRDRELIWQHYRTGRDIEFTLFSSRWVDGIVLNPVTQTVSQYQNTGINEAWGAELSETRQWRNWRFSGNLSHTRSRNVNADLDYSAFPRYLLNLGIGHEWPGGWQAWLNQRAEFTRTTTDSLAPLVTSDFMQTPATNPAPNKTMRAPGTSLLAIWRASSSVQQVTTPGRSTPGRGGSAGDEPVATSSRS